VRRRGPQRGSSLLFDDKARYSGRNAAAARCTRPPPRRSAASKPRRGGERRGDRIRSPAVSRCSFAPSRAFDSIVRYGCGTPFGEAVCRRCRAAGRDPRGRAPGGRGQRIRIPSSVTAALPRHRRLRAVMCTLHMPYRAPRIQAILGHTAPRLLPIRRPVTELEDADPLTPTTRARPRGSLPAALHLPAPPPRRRACRTRTARCCRTRGSRERTPAHRGRPDPVRRRRSRTSTGFNSLHCAWAVGACSVLLPAFRPEYLALLIEKQRASALWTAPAHIAAAVPPASSAGTDWSSLKLAIVSARSLLRR